MPYTRSGKCVYKKKADGSRGKQKGCSDSEEKAKKYMSKLYSLDETDLDETDPMAFGGGGDPSSEEDERLTGEALVREWVRLALMEASNLAPAEIDATPSKSRPDRYAVFLSKMNDEEGFTKEFKIRPDGVETYGTKITIPPDLNPSLVAALQTKSRQDYDTAFSAGITVVLEDGEEVPLRRSTALAKTSEFKKGGGSEARDAGVQYEIDLATLMRDYGVAFDKVTVPDPAGGGAGDDVEIRFDGEVGLGMEAKTSPGASFGSFTVQYVFPAGSAPMDQGKWRVNETAHVRKFPFLLEYGSQVAENLNSQGWITLDEVLANSDTVHTNTEGGEVIVTGTSTGSSAYKKLPKAKVSVPSSLIEDYYGGAKGNDFIQLGGDVGLYWLGTEAAGPLADALGIPRLGDSVSNAYFWTKFNDDRFRVESKAGRISSSSVTFGNPTAVVAARQLEIGSQLDRILAGFILYASGRLTGITNGDEINDQIDGLWDVYSPMLDDNRVSWEDMSPEDQESAMRLAAGKSVKAFARNQLSEVRSRTLSESWYNGKYTFLSNRYHTTDVATKEEPGRGGATNRAATATISQEPGPDGLVKKDGPRPDGAQSTAPDPTTGTTGWTRLQGGGNFSIRLATGGEYAVLDLDSGSNYKLAVDDTGAPERAKLDAGKELSAISTSVNALPPKSKVDFGPDRGLVPKVVFQLEGDSRYFLLTNIQNIEYSRSGGMSKQEMGLDYERRLGSQGQGTVSNLGDELHHTGPHGESEDPPPEERHQTLAAAAEQQKEKWDWQQETGRTPPGISPEALPISVRDKPNASKIVEAAAIGAACVGAYQNEFARAFVTAGNSAASDAEIEFGLGGKKLSMELKLSKSATLTGFTPVMTVKFTKKGRISEVTWDTAGEVKAVAARASGKESPELSTGDKMYGADDMQALWEAELATTKILRDAVAKGKAKKQTDMKYLKELMKRNQLLGTSTPTQIQVTGCVYNDIPDISKAILGGSSGASAKTVQLYTDATIFEKYYAEKDDQYILVGSVGDTPGMFQIGDGNPSYNKALELAGAEGKMPSLLNTGPSVVRFFFRSDSNKLYAQGQLNKLKLKKHAVPLVSLPGYTEMSSEGMSSYTQVPTDAGQRQRWKNLIALSIVSCSGDYGKFVKTYGGLSAGDEKEAVWNMIMTAWSESATPPAVTPEVRQYAKSQVRLMETRFYAKSQFGLLRERLIIEELTGADRSEIKRMIKKEIEGTTNKREIEKAFQKKFDVELKKALGTSFLGTPGKINKFVIDQIYDEVSKWLADTATRNEIAEITKQVLTKLYRELSFSSPTIIKRIKV